MSITVRRISNHRDDRSSLDHAHNAFTDWLTTIVDRASRPAAVIASTGQLAAQLAPIWADRSSDDAWQVRAWWLAAGAELARQFADTHLAGPDSAWGLDPANWGVENLTAPAGRLAARIVFGAARMPELPINVLGAVIDRLLDGAPSVHAAVLDLAAAVTHVWSLLGDDADAGSMFAAVALADL